MACCWTAGDVSLTPHAISHAISHRQSDCKSSRYELCERSETFYLKKWWCFLFRASPVLRTCRRWGFVKEIWEMREAESYEKVYVHC